MLRKPCSSSLRNLLHLLASLWIAISAASGQSTWRSTLYPANWQPPGGSVSFASAKLIQDFSYAGYKRGEEFLPAITGPIFDVTQYGADPSGATDSTTAIQSAINAAAAAGGGVVFLPAGEFRVSPQGTSSQCLRISSSNIVLRGAGHSATFLLNTSYEMREKSVIRVAPTSTSLGTVRNITANLPGPTRRIPVENAGSFSPGNIVRLQWNFTSDWVAENNQETWWGDSRPGSAIYFREVVTVDAAAGWIEVDVPTRYWVKTRDLPTVRTISGLLRNVGIESLSIGNLQHPGSGWGEDDYSDSTKAAYETHASWLIRFESVRDSWISDVRSRQATANTRTCHMLSNGILLLNCLRMTVQDCEMRRPQYGGGGGNGYMYRLQNSNECLIRNCIADFSRHGFVISHGGTSGNVFLQCEDRETARATGSSSSGYVTEGEGSDNHQFFSHSNLWDQCHAHNSFYTASHRAFNGGDPPHGVTSAHGIYWNTTGSGTRYADSSNPIVRSEQLNYGYIIGTRATSGSSAYFTSIPTGGNTSPADHREGVNTGAGLQPQSLYIDQLSRRLRPTITFQANGGSTAIPASIQVIFGATYGPLPSTSRPGFSFTGWFTALSGGEFVTAETTVSNSANHTLHARWNALPVVDAGQDQDLLLVGSIPWTPAKITTVAWYDAADVGTITMDGSNRVSQWNDKSGSNRHATQASDAAKPLSATRTMNGLNALAFSGAATQWLRSTSNISSQPLTAFAVTWFDSAGNDQTVFDGAGSARCMLRRRNFNVLSAFAGTWVDGNATSAEAVLASVVFDGTNSSIRKNGGTAVTGNAGAGNLASGLTIGNINSPAPSWRMDGLISELVFVSGTISDADRQKVEGYLAHKWGLAGNLPAGHPFKSGAPTVPAAVATLQGAATDANGDPLTHLWSVVSGPAPVIFDNPSSLTTTAAFTFEGVYTLRLTSNDGLGSRSDEVVITVNPSPFVQWAGPAETSFVQDSNADGLVDGLAWLLGAGTPASNASALLPLPRNDSGSLSVTFKYLIPANRGSYSMRLQHSTALAPDSWTDVEIPDASATVDGVEFLITPLPDGNLNEIKAVVPASAAGRVFVRLAATDPGS